MILKTQIWPTTMCKDKNQRRGWNKHRNEIHSSGTKQTTETTEQHINEGPCQHGRLTEEHWTTLCQPTGCQHQTFGSLEVSAHQKLSSTTRTK